MALTETSTRWRARQGRRSRLRTAGVAPHHVVGFTDDSGNGKGMVGYMNTSSNFSFAGNMNIIGTNANIGFGFYDGGSQQVGAMLVGRQIA